MPIIDGGLSYATGEPWSGRTRLNSTIEEVSSRLRRARTLPAEMVLEWLSDFEQQPDRSSSRASQIEAPATQTWHDAGFSGWVATPPPKPYYTAPIPLGLELPIGSGACPLAELQPWWDQLALDGAPTEPPIAVHSAHHARIGPWGRFGWSSGSVLHAHAEHGQFDVYGTHLNVWGRAQETTSRISGPGFIGSMVPGYAEIRSFASSASQSSTQFGFGCRVDFAFVSAVTLNLEWHLRAPLLSAPLKELVSRRGYGELSEAIIGIELTDGWRPWRIQLMQGAGGNNTEELDQRTIAFAQWLVQAIAAQRRSQPNLDSSTALVLDDLVSNPRQLQTLPDDKTRRAHFRCSIPASRPISWCSPS